MNQLNGTMLAVGGASLALLLLPHAAAAPAAPPPCSTRESPRSTAYQFRTQMDRCEGMRGSRPIAAFGLRLASYTIGQPQSERRAQSGEVYRLLVPAKRGQPDVKVQARGGEYQMIPLRLGSPRQGWRAFEWGVGLAQREGISASQLRATALLSQPGDADQWLPVKFAPAGVYSLVIASNGALPLANVGIFGPDNRLVHVCSGRTQLESELLCSWDGRIHRAGTYRLVARSEKDGGPLLLNVSLLHDPSWLTR